MCIATSVGQVNKKNNNYTGKRSGIVNRLVDTFDDTTVAFTYISMAEHLMVLTSCPGLFYSFISLMLTIQSKHLWFGYHIIHKWSNVTRVYLSV